LSRLKTRVFFAMESSMVDPPYGRCAQSSYKGLGKEKLFTFGQSSKKCFKKTSWTSEIQMDC
jgi:hypothetical protein